MKAGLVQMFHALAALPSPDGVCVLVSGDEEVGSPTSRELIEATARDCAAALVMEASADGQGALKTARKGTSRYEVVVHGKAAHARPPTRSWSSPASKP
jgi:glutamate carboxypeptidase